jgi:hypothetical protein
MLYSVLHFVYVCLLDILGEICKLVSDHQTAQANIRYLSDRCSALRPVLKSIENDWSSQQIVDINMQARTCAIHNVHTKLLQCKQLIEKHLDKGRIRQILGSSSFKQEFADLVTIHSMKNTPNSIVEPTICT